MGIPLYVTCCFSLAAFNTFSLVLVFISLFSMCLRNFFFQVHPVWDSLGFLVFCGCFLSHVGKAFHYNLFKYFLIPFLFLFFWDPYNSNVGALYVSQMSLGLSFPFFSLFWCASVIHHSMFHLTYPFFCLSYFINGSL